MQSVSIRTTLIILAVLVVLYLLTMPTKYKIVTQITNKIPLLNKIVGGTENYADLWYDNYPIYSTHTNFPFWNMQLGSTRNMSYDLRGDVPIYPNSSISPWLNSSIRPIYNKPLWMVS